MGTQDIRFGEIGDLSFAEAKRLLAQAELDSHKDIDERRRLGQYATPIDLAKEIVSYGLTLLEDNEISFIEPALGSGAFFSALLSELPKTKKTLTQAFGIEIDSGFCELSSAIWGNQLNVICNDFTELDSFFQANLLITNPPYVRHHLIPANRKKRLNDQVLRETGVKLSGLAGFYCHYLLLAQKWLAPGAISAWLIPSEFMDVNYGSSIRKYLLNHVKLLRIHRYSPEDAKFSDALVSSCVVWIKNEQDPSNYDVEFSYGGTHSNPQTCKTISKKMLSAERKWTHFPEITQSSHNDSVPSLGDFFDVKRGIATGDNDFFILTDQQIDDNKLDRDFFTPILPSPRHLKVNEIFADADGLPQLQPQRFLLNCTLPESEVESEHPYLWRYLLSGRQNAGSKYLCKSRKIWYLQEQRSSTPFLCSYMGRGSSEDGSPFRFILNHSNAIVTNSYLMLYPKDFVSLAMFKDKSLAQEIWLALKTITPEDLTCEGRVYGGGLKKIEPKELCRVKCPRLNSLLEDAIPRQISLF